MLTPEVTADLQHVPRFTSRVLARPSLLVRLDGPAPLVVLRAPGGTGKTTLMAQWAVATAPARHGSLLWIEADDGTRTRTGFWMRVLGRFHARGLIEDRALYREMASIADHADTIPATIRRVLDEHGQPVTLLLDDVGSAAEGSYWDEVCQDLVEILRRVPFARAVVAGRFRTVLEAASTRAVLDTQVITEEQLALSSEEIATLVDLTVPGLQGDPRRERSWTSSVHSRPLAGSHRCGGRWGCCSTPSRPVPPSRTSLWTSCWSWRSATSWRPGPEIPCCVRSWRQPRSRRWWTSTWRGS